ncbi:MAG: hypothetical protein K2X50_00985 [Gammaproteobacteria bacterium]|nr:hypothetical protein [Gammaproteobacteria bacterium]
MSNIYKIAQLLAFVQDNERNSLKKIHLIPSENTLSPLSRLPLLLDIYSRYYLNDFKRFGAWCFPSGQPIDLLENEFLYPILRELSGAIYINTKPISGMNCMTIALAGLADLGDSVLTIPVENGGHVSTTIVAERLGLSLNFIPFKNTFEIDYCKLEDLLKKIKPKLIYLDHATFLFPLDTSAIRALINRVTPDTILYYDTSHTNGLILCQAYPNPLEHGVDIYGGSTHKTLPGPHKAFLATNRKDLADKIESKSNHFVSHNHPSSSLSLAITLMEMKYCGGRDYANRIITNAKLFANILSERGFMVSSNNHNYTETHQVWAYPEKNIEEYTNLLSNLGIVINKFSSLPGINRQSYRLSVSEITRMGAQETEITELAHLMGDLLNENNVNRSLIDRFSLLQKKLSVPQYCYRFNDIESVIEDSKLGSIIRELLLYSNCLTKVTD